MYNAILKKNLAKKEDTGGYFMIPCNIGGLKYMDALVDQGSNVNVMPLSTYNRLTNENPIGANVKLSLASHSYIYPIGIAEDVLVEIAGYVYPVDFVVLDIKEDNKKPFILGTPFLTTAKAEIRFDKGTVRILIKKDNNEAKIDKAERGNGKRTNNQGRRPMSPPDHKKFRWGTIFPIGLKCYRDPKEEPIEKEPLMELNEIG
ncbi:retrovirus-related pol polyprotein from transposon TNT 1-94 [Tanacetum coccineum]